ncbi:MAG TPA: formate dehydrogenase subunit gamma [Terriglobia bacterium]|nr:formate dehydrogenase subunit gamma [Terriglobia bacterium]
MSSVVISRIVREFKTRPGALLPVLHAIQDELGYIPEDAVPIIASEMNLTRAEVHGVVTFYHDFRLHPPGRHIVRICQAESCQAAGSEALTAFARKRMGIGFHQTTPDRACSLEPVYCLGNCALSPSVMVDKEVYGRVTEERFDEILEEARKP